MSFRHDKKRGNHPITPKKGIKEVDLNIMEKGVNDTIKVAVKPGSNKIEKMAVVIPPLKNTTVKGGMWDLRYSAGDETAKSLEPLLDQMIKNYETYLQQNNTADPKFHYYKRQLAELKQMKGHLHDKPKDNSNFDTNMDLLVHMMRLDYFDYLSEKGLPKDKIKAIMDGKIPPPSS